MRSEASPSSPCWLHSTASVTEPIEDEAGRNPRTHVRWQVDLLARF